MLGQDIQECLATVIALMVIALMANLLDLDFFFHLDFFHLDFFGLSRVWNVRDEDGIL